MKGEAFLRPGIRGTPKQTEFCGSIGGRFASQRKEKNVPGRGPESPSAWMIARSMVFFSSPNVSRIRVCSSSRSSAPACSRRAVSDSVSVAKRFDDRIHSPVRVMSSRSFAQRSQRELKMHEPEIQVLAELAFGQSSGQIDVRRRDDADRTD